MRVLRKMQPVLALILCLVPASAEKKPKPPLEKTYETTVDKAFVAMVRAVGTTLVSEVKEACLVNFKFGRSTGGGYYIVDNVAATCRDIGNGKVSINFAPQIQTNMFRVGDFQDKNLATIWANIDHELIPPPTAPADAAAPAK
jgi:hypothetical protein